MRKIILAGLIILNAIASYSQLNTGDVSLEIRYPVSIGESSNGLDNNPTGLIDIGLDYTVLKSNQLGIGLQFNSSFLKFTGNDVNLVILSPKIKVAYEITLNKITFIPMVGLGYAYWSFRIPGVTVLDEFGNPLLMPAYTQNENGLTVKGATKFLFNTDKKINWYLNLSYEFTRLGESAEMVHLKRNQQLIYPGLGVIWNFGK